MDEVEPDYASYLEGRTAFDRGDYESAIALFHKSLDISVHHKTLELIGESFCQLGRARDAIIPLAAATGLNRGSRAPCLLAEAFALIGEWRSAKDAANEALRRTPAYGRAKIVLDEATEQLANRNT